MIGDHSDYFTAVRAEDARLGRHLAGIRDRQDAGELSARAAAELRVMAMTEHLAAYARLRKRFLGDQSSTRPDDNA